jgi:hypothetical protein
MDYQFMRHCIGLAVAPDKVSDQVTRTILRRPFDPLLMDTDALYDLTHVVFYATRFGCMPWRPRQEIEAWLRQNLDAITLARFLMDDADLGAELLLVHFYTHRPVSRLTERCVERLLAARTSTGAFRGPNRPSESIGEFDANYHTTLVAMAALAEADLRCHHS